MDRIWNKTGENMPYKKRDKTVKERIYLALIRLISSDRKPSDQLTIQEIVDEAGVCRNSFYRNFLSKDDIFTDKFQEVAIQSGKIMKSLHGDFVSDMIFSFFETARLNKEFLLCFYKAAPKKYFDTFTGVIIESNIADKTEEVSPQDYYTYAARAWITVGILTEWISRDCDMPIQDIIVSFRKWSIGLLS